MMGGSVIAGDNNCAKFTITTDDVDQFEVKVRNKSTNEIRSFTTRMFPVHS